MRTRYRITVLAIALASLVCAPHASQAQSGGGYDLTWNSIDGGGMIESTGGTFSLSGTIGQPDVGVVLGGGAYSLVGDFWAGVPPYATYLPVVMKQ
jgi:hypothetical protein